MRALRCSILIASCVGLLLLAACAGAPRKESTMSVREAAQLAIRVARGEASPAEQQRLELWLEEDAR